MQATITKNGQDFDEGSLDTILQYFADPVSDALYFNLAVDQIVDENVFEFVKNNDVYVINTSTCLNCDGFTTGEYCSTSCEDLDRF